ncbi:MAG: hypothetical protein KGQ57_12635, partial [Burkholderiales bacterium]|nr:hypothetical protein [Burkholderiales bacterium]
FGCRRTARDRSGFFSSRFMSSDFMLLLNTRIASSPTGGVLFHPAFLCMSADVLDFFIRLTEIYFRALSIDLLEFIASCLHRLRRMP